MNSVNGKFPRRQFMEELKLTAAAMSKLIDHTLLKPEASHSSFDFLCSEALQYGFKAVCVNSAWVAYVADRVRGSEVAVCSVIGFPLGAMDSAVKAFEAETAMQNGATELDMVLNVGALKGGSLKAVEADILTVRRAAASPTVLKVIKACLLTEAEKIHACEIAKHVGADFVKTSTGFSSGGATVKDVALMRRVVGPTMGIKASGGIKDWATARVMIDAGATRIGTSAGVTIVESAPD
jgi:deoxyribose-phosphate aldolase